MTVGQILQTFNPVPNRIPSQGCMEAVRFGASVQAEILFEPAETGF